MSLVSREDDAGNEYPSILDPLEKAEPDLADGWDPYEVWRTRVKPLGKAGKRNQRGPRS